MFEKNMKIAYLLDIYGELLDDHIAEVMHAYYDDDLSLSEIAADDGISRQGIRHLIKKGEEKLNLLEDKLGLAKRYAELEDVCKSLADISASLSRDVSHADDARAINNAIEIIMKGSQDVR